MYRGWRFLRFQLWVSHAGCWNLTRVFWPWLVPLKRVGKGAQSQQILSKLRDFQTSTNWYFAGKAAATFQDGSNTSTHKNVVEELPLESEEELLSTFIVSCGCSNVAQEEIYHGPISPLAVRNSVFVHEENNSDPRRILVSLFGFSEWNTFKPPSSVSVAVIGS